jgi:hypothetical protein
MWRSKYRNGSAGAPADLACIAAVIFKARISVEDAERIPEEEVAPTFTPNLLGVAGEWAGWSEEFVKERVLTHLKVGAAQRAIARFRARRHRTLYMETWKGVAGQLAQIQHAE